MFLMDKFLDVIGEPPCLCGLTTKVSAYSQLIDDPLMKPIVVEGELVGISISDMINMSQAEQDFFITAMKLKTEVLSSLEFKKLVLSKSPTQRGGMSSLQVYNKVIGGWDTTTKMYDRDLDFAITLYNGDSRTIGYATVGRLKITTNRVFVKDWMKQALGPAYLAGHIFHEYLHAGMGLIHKGNSRNSLVYVWGYCVRDLAIDVLNGRKLTVVSRQELLETKWR